jgi:hypothetical protein
MTIRKAAAMDPISFEGARTVGNHLNGNPKGKEVLRRHFGEDFLAQQRHRFLSLRLACILKRVSLVSVVEDLWGLPPFKRRSSS